MPLTSFVAGGDADAAQVNQNFNLCLLTDTAKTVDAVHNFVNGLQVGGDTLISEGSNANGRWVKFAGGLMICYATLDLGSVAVTTAYGAGFRSALIGTLFPAVFAAAPTVLILPSADLLQVGVQGRTSGGVDWYMTSFVSLTTGADAMILAIGRWK